MHEYLMLQLWKRHEERMLHELERQRVVEERMLEQARSTTVEPELEPAVRDIEYVLVDE